MKYSCEGCRYQGTKQTIYYPCATCGTYILSGDGESTVYVYNNWKPKDEVLTVDVTIIQKPVLVKFECPYCEEGIKIDYKDFCAEVGEPCDWSYSKIECPKCGKSIQIDDVDWD